jgi:hypothetical protein
MKKIALALSAFAVLAFSGMARAEGDAAKAEAPKTEKATKKTTKKADKAAEGATATPDAAKTEKPAK